jgi:hypothetical protein
MRRILIAGVLLAAACAKKDRTDASGQGTGTARAVLATPDAASAVADAEPPPPPRAPPPPVTLPGGKPLALADCAKVTDDFKREACELLFEDVVLCHERGGESAE